MGISARVGNGGQAAGAPRRSEQPACLRDGKAAPAGKDLEVTVTKLEGEPHPVKGCEPGVSFPGLCPQLVRHRTHRHKYRRVRLSARGDRTGPVELNKINIDFLFIMNILALDINVISWWALEMD